MKKNTKVKIIYKQVQDISEEDTQQRLNSAFDILFEFMTTPKSL